MIIDLHPFKKNMKHNYLILLAALLLFSTNSILSQKRKKNQVPDPKNQVDSVSYAIGISIAKSFEAEFKEINIDQFINAVKSKLDTEKEPLFSDNDAQEMVQQFFQAKREESAANEKEKFDSVIKEGELFLKENGKRKEVVTLPSGLQYEIINQGNGPQPTATDKVETHYHGTLLDGTVFDSSVDRGTPISFPVNGVIKGWTQALQLMSVGSKWKLYIPYQLAYGERGAGGAIGPYATLIFEVELISINK